MSNRSSDHQPTYERIYAVVREIPPGKVATYGQIASIVGKCTARMVGYAMATLSQKSNVPWQRVINAQGKISLRGDGDGSERQRLLLEAEGVVFKANGAINLRVYRWPGPPLDWLLEHGYEPMPDWQEG